MVVSSRMRFNCSLQSASPMHLAPQLLGSRTHGAMSVTLSTSIDAATSSMRQHKKHVNARAVILSVSTNEWSTNAAIGHHNISSNWTLFAFPSKYIRVMRGPIGLSQPCALPLPPWTIFPSLLTLPFPWYVVPMEPPDFPCFTALCRAHTEEGNHPHPWPCVTTSPKVFWVWKKVGHSQSTLDHTPIAWYEHVMPPPLAPLSP